LTALKNCFEFAARLVKSSPVFTSGAVFVPLDATANKHRFLGAVRAREETSEAAKVTTGLCAVIKSFPEEFITSY
jgi:hypothetical protein